MGRGGGPSDLRGRHRAGLSGDREVARRRAHGGVGRRRQSGPGSGRAPAASRRRKWLVGRAPELLPALDRKLDPVTRGDPMSPLHWTRLSAAKLDAALSAEGLAVSGRGPNRLCTGSATASRRTVRSWRYAASRPGRAIPAHLPQCAGVPGRGAARRLGEHLEQDMKQGAALVGVAAFDVGDQLELGVAVGGGDSGNGVVADAQGEAVGPQEAALGEGLIEPPGGATDPA